MDLRREDRRSGGATDPASPESPAGSPRRTARARIGTSGFDYRNWRGTFYPAALPRSRWLEHLSRVLDSVEINGTFYSLKSPSVFARWALATPEEFAFAVKGSRFVTHNLGLRNAETALANFAASGVLALGRKTGPFLWQLPDTHAFSADRLEPFLRLLPRSAREAEALAAHHDARLARGSLTSAPDPGAVWRHAFEVRHASWFDPATYQLLRTFGAALAIADSAGRWPTEDVVTADFVYVRLHGSHELYSSRYGDDEIAAWGARVVSWLRRGLDVYVYFDNDARGHAPHDARRLREHVDRELATPSGP